VSRKYSTTLSQSSIVEEYLSPPVGQTLTQFLEEERETLFRPKKCHQNSITNLECIEVPSVMLISGSKDGFIKVWR
jgi:hypothetical protein